jgi:hypothetical protein
MYENRRVKPVEIVLRMEEGRRWGMVEVAYLIKIYL